MGLTTASERLAEFESSIARLPEEEQLRRLEAEAARNLELIWLLGGLRPDFKTIAEYRRENRAAFKGVLEMAQNRDVYMRDAAYMVAIDRVVKAMQLRGWV